MTTYLIQDGEIRVRDEHGWRHLYENEAIDTGDGNELHINSDSYWTGWYHGLMLGLVIAFGALATLAIIAGKE